MKIIRGLCYVFVWICMILTAALMLLMVAEVLSRAIINKAILGSTEMAQVLLVFLPLIFWQRLDSIR